MKKNSLGILAGLCVLLTGCGGTKFVNEAKESNNKATVEVKQTLSLKGYKDGTGDFALTTKSTEEYLDGAIQGVFGVGKVEGDVKVVTTGKETGTWTKDADSGVVTLTTFELVMQVKVTGDGAEDYLDILEATYTLAYGEENADKLIAGEKVTITYEDGYKSLVKVDEANKTFSGILG